MYVKMLYTLKTVLSVFLLLLNRIVILSHRVVFAIDSITITILNWLKFHGLIRIRNNELDSSFYKTSK